MHWCNKRLAECRAFFPEMTTWALWTRYLLKGVKYPVLHLSHQARLPRGIPPNPAAHQTLALSCRVLTGSPISCGLRCSTGLERLEALLSPGVLGAGGTLHLCLNPASYLLESGCLHSSQYCVNLLGQPMRREHKLLPSGCHPKRPSHIMAATYIHPQAPPPYLALILHLPPRFSNKGYAVLLPLSCFSSTTTCGYAAVPSFLFNEITKLYNINVQGLFNRAS